MDKVNMSLDEIIKLNRNQNRQNKFAANRNLNGNKNNNNNNNNGNRRNNNYRSNQQQQRRPQQQQLVSNKPYGMLNKSKTIQKRNNFQNKQNVLILNNKNQQQQVGRRFPRNLANRRRRLPNSAGAPQRLFNRFGSGAANKFQNRQRQPNGAANKINTARTNNSNNQPKQNNVKRFRQMPNKSANAQKRLQQLRQPRAANNVKNKIVMQSARKNVMKAKRLLAKKTTKKGPIQQIMTQRYAKNLGLIQAKKSVKLAVPARKPAPKQNKMLTVSINNKVNKVNRVKQVQKKTIQKAAQSQFKKPILNRNRQQQGQQSNAGRKVFF